MVLIFSTPVRSQIASKPENSWFISSISSAGARRAEISVNPTTSLNRTLTASWRSAISVSPASSRSMIRCGSTLSSSRSDFARSSSSSVSKLRRERRVRVLELLEPADVGLEPLEAPGEPAVLLLQLVGRARAGRLGRQAGPVPSADADPSRTETIVALWNRVRSADGHRRDLAQAVEAADRHGVPEDLAHELDLAAGSRPQQELARRAGEEQSAVRPGAAGEAGQRVRDRRLRPLEDLVGAGHGQLDGRALRDGAEERDRPALTVVGHRRPKVEAIRARRLEDGQRVGDRRLAGADIPLVELERGSSVDLEHAGVATFA